MTLSWNVAAIRAAGQGPEAQQAMIDLGIDVARDAAAAAPKETGDGARSIHAELIKVRGVPEVRVSWDREHFYMAFQELGFEHTLPKAFLRHAADRQR